ncbi:unnamed protein product [Heterosigma akashiwo]|mmetsp:Transcript_112569/g.257840  ORF Transcript_112569/g.257840 Transcript_112569/m.257840 type:complete len:110 (-) Transcript_112569:709-1038(-)
MHDIYTHLHSENKIEVMHIIVFLNWAWPLPFSGHFFIEFYVFDVCSKRQAMVVVGAASVFIFFETMAASLTSATLVSSSEMLVSSWGSRSRSRFVPCVFLLFANFLKYF